MDLKQLRHFIAIVDHGTFLSAAKAIHISQPALSRSLQNLEAHLGVPLLNRSTRGIQITPAGERFYRRAKLILMEAQKAASEARKEDITPGLNIGMAPLFADQYVPKALHEVTKNYPALHFNIISALFPVLIEKLSSGEIDIMVSNLPFTDIPNDLTVEPIFDISICYIASASHPLANKAQCTFNDLKSFPWAVVDEENANNLYQYILTSEGETRSPISVKTNSLTLLKSIVRTPPFITLLPSLMVEEDIIEARLVALKTSQDYLKRKGGLIYRKNHISSPQMEALRDAVRALAG